MGRNKIDIGNWVEFYHISTRQILLGFVLTIGKFEVKVYVPKENKIFIIPLMKVSGREKVDLNQEDIQTLINLALDFRDFAWLANLVSS